MVMVHPGDQANLGDGPRLLVELPASHAATVGVTVDPDGGLAVAKHPRGRWIVQGTAGSSGRLSVVSASGGPMVDALTVRLSLPGSASDGGFWELGDVHVDGRARVDVASVEVTPAGSWLVRSLIRPGAVSSRSRQQASTRASAADPSGSQASAASPPVVAGDPVTVDVVVAVDRSASMQWAFEGPGLESVVQGLLTARHRALTPESVMRWFTCGSTSDDSDGPHEVDSFDRTAEEIARALRPTLPSSGSRAGALLPRMTAGQFLVSVTDHWPEAELAEACEARGVRLAAVILGIPPDPTGWPADWRVQAQRCEAGGIPVLAVGDGARSLAAVRDWGMQRLASPAQTEPVEAPR